MSIRYVCLSDLHLGADNSVLTHVRDGRVDPTVASPALQSLVACLREWIPPGEKPPSLIVHGDFLELALATMDQSLSVFERFIELVFPRDGAPLFDETIIFVPGNHDHHLWEIARETAFFDTLQDRRPGDPITPPWHITPLFAEPVDASAPLTGVLRRFDHLSNARVATVYPNLGIRSASSDRTIVIHHGHYIENAYYLMSTLNGMFFPDQPAPATVAQIERENFAWIDFFWSTMGRSGAAGTDVEIVYAKLRDPRQIHKLIQNLALGIVRHRDNARLLIDVEEKALTAVLGATLGRLGQMEVYETDSPLADDARMLLQRYLAGPLVRQLTEEGKPLPDDLTFVFGHTHKPFLDSMTVDGIARPVAIVNSGGWVVDTLAASSLHGGAVILIDDALDVASVTMYSEGTSDVRAAASAGSRGALATRLQDAVDMTREPWKDFSRAVAEAVDSRRAILTHDVVEAP